MNFHLTFLYAIWWGAKGGT